MFRTCFALLTLLTSFSLHAQTADEIIAKNIAARGGYDKVKSMKTIIYEGYLDQSYKMKLSYDHMNAMKMEIDFANLKAQVVYMTTKGWNIEPGDSVVSELGAEDVKERIPQLDIQGLFVDYKAKGYTAAYEGKEAGTGDHIIRLKKTGEKDKIFYFNSTFMLSKFTTDMKNEEGQYEPLVTLYDDYRKNEDGFMVAYKRSSGESGVVFNKIITNKTMPASYFEPPK